MAERVLLSLEEVRLSFGGKPLFDGVKLHITERDRICLVGRNGVGKTTLMRLICGELELDGGKRFAVPGLRIGYLPQQVRHDPSHDVRQFVLAGLPRTERDETHHHRADMVITPLQLDPAARMETLSGGQLRRAALAQALVAEPDILLLDEPTNHLDLTAIEWLEQYLARYPGSVLCVSHDRAFLSAVSRKVFWIDRGQIRTCPKGYREFDAWAEQLLEQEARALHNMQKKMEAEIDWTQGGVSARRKRNQRRLRELERMRETLKSDKAAYNQTLRTVELDPLTTTPASKIICEFKQVSKYFAREDGRNVTILKNFNLRILRGDRIGILGKNGSGKSTFLKLLTGEITADTGRISRGKTVDIAYFDQQRSLLDPKKTLWETLCPDGGSHVFLGTEEAGRSIHVCGYLKRFLFDPKRAHDQVMTLSGGQQHRLMLAKIMINPGNVLILDEPTNDLDMDTLDMLQEMLAEYPGTLIIVSHDRDFLDRTVTKVLAFEGEAKVEGYMGGYSDYVAARAARYGDDGSGKSSSAMRASSFKAPYSMGDGEFGADDLAAASEAYGDASSLAPLAKQGKLSYKFRHELEQLPAKIAALETEISALKTVLSDPDLYTAQPATFDASSARLAAASAELDAAETRWLELEALREAYSSGA